MLRKKSSILPKILSGGSAIIHPTSPLGHPTFSKHQNLSGDQQLPGDTSSVCHVTRRGRAPAPHVGPGGFPYQGLQPQLPVPPTLQGEAAPTQQNRQGEYRGGKLHLICFKYTEVLIFWDVFLLYIFVNVKCSRCQICLICKWKPILLSPPYSS